MNTKFSKLAVCAVLAISLPVFAGCGGDAASNLKSKPETEQKDDRFTVGTRVGEVVHIDFHETYYTRAGGLTMLAAKTACNPSTLTNVTLISTGNGWVSGAFLTCKAPQK